MGTESFYISTDKSKLDLDMIVDYLSNDSYWAKGRARRVIEKSIHHSITFGVFTSEHKQAGFARVVSDQAVYAWVMDVFILENYRNKGLAKMLMQSIVTHPELQGLQRWGLATKDAHRLYKQFGFTTISKPEMLMEIVNKPMEN